MGNQTSQFEQQFYKLYNFIGVIDEPYFKQVKIYRKIKYAFNYIMIVQNPIIQLNNAAQTSEIKQLIKERLRLIRKHQNQFTSKLQYYHMLEDKPINCSASLIKMYIQYYNYTLHDYLNALRINRYSLKIQELIFVIRCLAEAILTLRKMKLKMLKLSLFNIFVSVEFGKIVINPVYFLYEQINRSVTVNNLTPQNLLTGHPHINYESYSNFEIDPLQEQRQLENIEQIFIEMTRYLNIKEINQMNQPYALFKRLKNVRQILDNYKSNLQQLNVEQFCDPEQSNYQLYDTKSKEKT